MAKNGLNEIGVVYYINLDRRPDRNEQIQSELKKTNIDQTKINRIPGHDVPQCGAYGCSLSHIDAVTNFLQTTGIKRIKCENELNEIIRTISKNF